MPGSKSINKAARSAEKRRLRNRSVRSTMGTHVIKASKLVAKGEAEPAQNAVVTAISSIDKAVSKGVIHRNKGARLKARLVKKLNQSIQ